MRFDARPLTTYFQFIDTDLMRDRLLESLYYLHMQPPGMNLMAGIIVKLFPDSPSVGLHFLYMLFGLVTALCTFHLMRVFGVGERTALVLTGLFTISPGLVLFENLLMYEYVCLALLSLAAVWLYRWISTGESKWAFGFHFTMLSLMLVRNSFMLPYYLLIVGCLWWFQPARRRTTMLAASIPVLVILGLHFKNWVLFNQFTLSTWAGLNVGTVTTHQLTDDEKKMMREKGQLSAMALVGPAENLSAYKPYITMPPPTGIAVLDREENAVTRRANFNNPAYFPVHQSFIRDGISVLRNYPKAYLRSVARAWFAYFLPLGDYPFFTMNRPKIHAFDRVFNVVFFGQFRAAETRRDLRAVQDTEGAGALVLFTGTFLMIGMPLLFVYGCRRLWRGWKDGSIDGARLGVLAFLIYNIAFLTAISNFLSCFENNRYRLPLDGFFLVLAAMAITSVMAGRAQPAQDRVLVSGRAG